MPQLSLFAADSHPAEVSDVAGMLAAHGQSGVGDSGASVSIVVDDRWRASALSALLDEAGLACSVNTFEGTPVSPTDDVGSGGGDDDPGTRYSVATERTRVLAALVRRWRKGAVKSVPPDWTPTPGQIRFWVLSAGRPVAPSGYGLGIDTALEQHAPQRDALLGALARAGLTATFVRSRGSGPLLRITSVKRLRRLAETVGARPDGVPADVWPEAGPR